MNTTEQNNARFHSNLSEQHADKVIAVAIKLLGEDVKQEIHDARMYSVEGGDLETANRLKIKQQMVEEAIKSLKRMLLK